MVFASMRLSGLTGFSSIKCGTHGVCSQVKFLKKAREVGRQKENSVDVLVTSQEPAAADKLILLFCKGSWAGADTDVAVTAAGTITVCAVGATLTAAVPKLDDVNATLVAADSVVFLLVEAAFSGVDAALALSRPKLVKTAEFASAEVSGCNDVAVSYTTGGSGGDIQINGV